jgi:hypothetical protein
MQSAVEATRNRQMGFLKASKFFDSRKLCKSKEIASNWPLENESGNEKRVTT